jgi:uncharacterized protein
VFAPDTKTDFAAHSDTRTHHERDIYGFPVEIDVGEDAGRWYDKGRGHRKLGVFGRARWENVTFVTGTDWQLTPGKPVVIYAGDDRRSGRIYKFVSTHEYKAGMTREQTRALLDEGILYAAHFENLDNDSGLTVGGTNPALEGGINRKGTGTGRWVKLNDWKNNSDIPPNAGGELAGGYVKDLGSKATTVPQALQDLDYNGIGGFDTENLMLSSLFTVCAKLGIRELNRPEDLEWEPHTGILYVAFTNHTGQTALDARGVLYDPAAQPMTPRRADKAGAIFGMIEAGDPASSRTFTFWSAWQGTLGSGEFDAADPDNIVIDRDGGVWFGTDGNFGTNKTADAFYYLALDNQGKGRAFRVLSVPSDAECTGPCLSSDMRTLFAAVQHPGENRPSTWPPRE